MVTLSDNTAGLTLLVVQAIFTPLAIVSVGLRLWARRFTAAPLAFSDYAVIIALLFVLGEAAAGWVEVLAGGAGRPIADLTPPERLVFGQSLFADQICWMLSNCFVKLSILHFVNSIFYRRPWFPRCVYALAASVSLACVACVLYRLFDCRPLAYTWDRTIPNGACQSQSPGIISGGLSLGLDIAILLLPLPVIFGLQMRAIRKFALLCVFGVGIM